MGQDSDATQISTVVATQPRAKRRRTNDDADAQDPNYYSEDESDADQGLTNTQPLENLESDISVHASIDSRTKKLADDLKTTHDLATTELRKRCAELEQLLKAAQTKINELEADNERVKQGREKDTQSIRKQLEELQGKHETQKKEYESLKKKKKKKKVLCFDTSA